MKKENIFKTLSEVALECIKIIEEVTDI